MEIRYMYKITSSIRVTMLLLIFALPFQAKAQLVSIEGKVTDSINGNAIPGVSIVVKGTAYGTITDINGYYSIKVKRKVTLFYAADGYIAREVPVLAAKEVNIALKPEAIKVQPLSGINENPDLTGAKTTLTVKEFQKGNIVSPEQLLTGKIAGLQVTPVGAAAAGGSIIRIRGGSSLNAGNSPLLIIDGVPVEGNSISGAANLLSTINPDDIESISVLKDASAAALYGSKASNGVLIITSKKGKTGGVKLNYNTQFSLGKVSDYAKVLDAGQVRSIITADAAATGNNTYKNLLGTENTNWQKEIYQYAIGWNNNLSAAGSLKYMPFRLSAGYLSQEGVLKTDHYNRFSTSLTVSPKFFDDHLAVNLNAKFTQTANRIADDIGAIGGATSFDPTQAVTGGSATYGGYQEWLLNGRLINTNGPAVAPNPVALLQLRDNTSQINRLIGNVQLDYKVPFFPDVHVLVSLGIDNTKGRGDDNMSAALSTAAYKGGIYTHYRQKKRNTFADVSLYYARELPDIQSKFDVLAGHSYQDFYTNIYNFPSYNESGQADATTIPSFNTDKPEYRLESYLARANYTYKEKYLLTASVRRDASSKFSPATRVGYFPAIAFAWKLKDEYLKTSEVVSDLKLRVGWGLTGQQDVGSYYPYLSRYSIGSSTSQYQLGNTFYPSLRPEAYDPNLKWETTAAANLGLDFAFYKGRISGSLDVYSKKTKDLLSIIPIAPGANFDDVLLTNAGNMKSKGVELTVNAIPMQKSNLTWQVGFNFSYSKAKITNILNYEDPDFRGIDVGLINGGTGNYIGKFAVGYAPYTYFVFKQVYDAATGAPIEGLYEDLNKDGNIDDADRYYYKKPAADISYGINTTLNYKKWSMAIAGHGMVGNYLYNNFSSNNGTLRALQNPLLYISNVSDSYLATNFSNMHYTSDHYIENASFFRLDNINVGYNLGNILRKGKSDLRVNASVQNVFVLTKYTGGDPEISASSGVDYVMYPHPRVFVLGFDFDF